jgi:hypothetical protein
LILFFITLIVIFWIFVPTGTSFVLVSSEDGLIFYTTRKTGKITYDDNMFEQNRVRVEFNTGKITINGKSYNVNQVNGIETKKIASLRSIISIKPDDFNKPVQIVMRPGAGEKFAQRLYTAHKKAEGPSFY